MAILINCEWCGNESLKTLGEFHRSRNLGRSLYCSRSCAAHANNKDKIRKQIIVICPCGKEVTTTTHNKAKKHCDRSCASKYSMTNLRREAQRQSGRRHIENLSNSAALKSREGWKYELLKKALIGRIYEFEYSLKGRVYDLALLDVHILIEFDDPKHIYIDDKKKDQIAKAAGFSIVRRSVNSNTIINPDLIKGL